MLSYDLNALESHAIQVDGDLGTEDAIWGPEDIRPSDDVHVSGRLSSAGSGRVYFSGALAGSVDTSCRRCLTPVRAPVGEDVHFLFAREGDHEIDDPDVYVIDARAHELDLRPAIREQWLLSVPSFALCRDDCKGLCPQCGTDLNQGPCDCEPAADGRWDALRKARGTS